MEREDDHGREAFLIEWYKILWNNARQSMDGLWKLVGPLTLVGSVWVAINQNFIPYNLGNSLVFVILFWAINITIDYNQWHRRNLIFLTAVEREFFTDKDYGRLIPSKFKIPKSSWVGFYRICGFIFCALLILSVYASFFPPGKEATWNAPVVSRYDLLILIVGIVFSWCNYRNQEKSTKSYIDELFASNSELRIRSIPGFEK